MATVTTKISDLVSVDYYNNQPSIALPTDNQFINSGAAVNTQYMDQVAANGQGYGTMVAWYDTDQSEPNYSTDDPDVNGSISKLDQTSWKARVNYYNKIYGYAQLVQQLSNPDTVHEAILSKFATYWDVVKRQRLLNTAKGIVAQQIANDGRKLVFDGSAANGSTPVDLDASLFFDGVQETKGQYASQIKLLVMHSKVANQLLKPTSANPYPNNGQMVLTDYQGIPVILDDTVTVDGTLYTTYGFGAGFFGLGNGPRTAGVQNNELAGNGGGTSVMVERKTDVIHPFGFSYAGSDSVISTPNLATLSSAGTYTRVIDPSLIPFFAIQSGVKNV